MTITTEILLETINAGHKKIEAHLATQGDRAAELGSRMTALEQHVVALDNSGMVGHARRPSWGQRVAVSDGLRAFQNNGLRGQARVELKNAIETASGLDQEGLVAPDRLPIQGLPQQRLTVRDLIPAVVTSSNKIDYVRQTSRENNAAPVVIGALKPESDLGFELAEAPVRTIAHWIPCPRQTFEDVQGLAALIDGELRFGLRLAEEHQILAGDGTGQNLLGLIPQAQAFAPPFAIQDENALDRVLLAIAQAQQSRLPVDGVLVNDLDWAKMISLKDDEGRYLAGAGGGPFGTLPGLLWQVRVVPTPSMQTGEVLVGAFGLAARLHDRMDVEVLISSEDRDNFIKNMLTIRAEERTALAVRVPDAFVYIDELGIGFSG
ncbi:MAG: phage major capsid protein [Alphaproteobacteria bacterium]|nr:phage major capsid protein [Alphaproteobacteria bacterium]